jgi:hypothetical protein
VLTAIKVRPGSVVGTPTLAATADLDGVCARRLITIAWSGRRNGRQSNQGTCLCIGIGE